MALIKIKLPRLDSTKTDLEKYNDMLKEMSQEDLNISEVRDFHFEWKCAVEAIGEKAEFYHFLTKFEFNIEARLKQYWGEAAYILPDRSSKTIKCFHTDGRKFTLG